MPRNEPADALKAALMILVVVGHVFLESVSGNALKGAIYVFHMPMFLALSGYWFKPPSEPRRDCRRHFGLSHAAMAGSSSIA